MIEKKRKAFGPGELSLEGRGREIMEQDALKIRQVTPGFELPPKVVPPQGLSMQTPRAPEGSRPILNFPPKKDEKE